MKRKTTLFQLLALLMLMVSVDSFSQNVSSVRQRLNYIFQPLEKNRVPTGFLLDYAIDLVDFTQYDGAILTDSNYVSLPIYEDILHSLYPACVRPTKPIYQSKK